MRWHWHPHSISVFCVSAFMILPIAYKNYVDAWDFWAAFEYIVGIIGIMTVWGFAFILLGSLWESWRQFRQSKRPRPRSVYDSQE